MSLPGGWSIVCLKDFVSLKTGPFGSSLHKSDYVLGGVPIINPMHIVNGQIVPTEEHRVDTTTAERLSEFRVREQDIVIGRRGEMGRCAVVRSFQAGWLCGTGSLIVRIKGAASADYLQKYLSSDVAVSYLQDESVGSTMANLNQAVLLDLKVPLPPVSEQQRIVAKVEELLSDLDAAVAELKAARKKLAHYRQSLLKAAVKGALTAEWRKHNKPKESGAQLLKRVLKARRSRWEQKQRAKFEQQGKAAPNDWQKKYLEPVAPDTAGLPVLPEGWVWASIDQLLSQIETGKSFKCEERPPRNDEVGVVKVSAVTWGEYDEEESKTCRDNSKIRPELFVRSGDFLFSRANTIELVGACVIARRVSKRVMLSDKILRFVLVDDLLKPWLLALLRSEIGRNQIETLASGNQESMRNIGQERLKKIAVPVPSAAEMALAINSLTASLDAARLQESAIDLSIKQSSAQRQNTLRAAFAGQLVPQDPNDEPASRLLERISAERAERAKQPNARKTKQKDIAAVVSKLMDVLKDAGDWVPAQEAFRRCGVTDGALTERIEELYAELRKLDKAGRLAVEAVTDAHGRKLYDKLKLREG